MQIFPSFFFPTDFDSSQDKLYIIVICIRVNSFDRGI